ncbi:MAG: hypothetical protein IJ629_03075 [Clostridia bacterium]|nr:hypothetical protein [Clostridia bacterium]
MTIATALLIVGLVLLAGPTILRWLLGGFSLIVPVSTGTTVYLCGIILMFAVLVYAYRKTLVSVNEEETDRRRSRRRNIRKAISILSVISALSVALIALHSPITWAYKGWSALLEVGISFFRILRYLGITMIVGAVGFFVGKNYKDKLEQEEPPEEHYIQGGREFYGENEEPRYQIRNWGRTYRIPHVIDEEEIEIHLPKRARKNLG